MAQSDEQKLEQLKQKYQSVLNLIQQVQVRLQNVHVQDGKLLIRGIAPSQEVKNRVWDQIKLVDATYSDLTADITVDEKLAQEQPATAAHEAQTARTYTVKPGDTLSKISRQFYGADNQYIKIFEANRAQFSDPNKIRVGLELVIP
jgi:LysM repeat protein